VQALVERGYDVACTTERDASRDIALRQPDVILVDHGLVEEARNVLGRLERSEPQIGATPLVVLGPDSAERAAPSATARESASVQAIAAAVDRIFAQTERPTSSQPGSSRTGTADIVVAGMAHEIRSPLAAILLNVHELAHALPSNASTECRAMLADIRDAVQRIEEVVRDVQSAVRPDDGTATMHVEPLLDSSLRLVRHQLERRARLIRDYGKSPPIAARRGPLGQLFLNLLANAAQAIPEGSQHENSVRVTTRTGSRGECVVEIADSGSGIAAADLPRIFEPFFTTRRGEGGSGLGLSLCQAIVSSLGGRISAHSVLGRGTTLRVTLPPADRGLRAAPRNKRILLIDDDALLARTVARGLTPHDVTSVTNGDDALAEIGRGELYDVVICDVLLPNASGERFYREVCERHPELEARIVFITGAIEGDPRIAWMADLPNRVLGKPFDLEELRDVVERRD
jgi:signal transduction histidine kinase